MKNNTPIFLPGPSSRSSASYSPIVGNKGAATAALILGLTACGGGGNDNKTIPTVPTNPIPTVATGFFELGPIKPW